VDPTWKIVEDGPIRTVMSTTAVNTDCVIAFDNFERICMFICWVGIPCLVERIELFLQWHRPFWLLWLTWLFELVRLPRFSMLDPRSSCQIVEIVSVVEPSCCHFENIVPNKQRLTLLINVSWFGAWIKRWKWILSLSLHAGEELERSVSHMMKKPLGKRFPAQTKQQKHDKQDLCVASHIALFHSNPFQYNSKTSIHQPYADLWKNSTFDTRSIIYLIPPRLGTWYIMATIIR